MLLYLLLHCWQVCVRVVVNVQVCGLCVRSWQGSASSLSLEHPDSAVCVITQRRLM